MEDKIITIPSRKKFHIIWFRIQHIIEDIPWQFRRRWYKIQFLKRLWKFEIIPWDMCDTFPLVIFEMLEYFFERHEDHFMNQYGSETEKEAYERYMDLFKAYSWYKWDRINMQNKIDRMYDKLHVDFGEFKMEFKKIYDNPENHDFDLYEMIDNKPDGYDINIKEIWALEEKYVDEQEKHLHNILKHYRTLWD